MSEPPRTEELVKKDLDHVLHPATLLRDHARTGPLVFVEGHGIWLKDSDGREYIDGFAGLWNVSVGHGRTAIVDAIQAQAQKLAYATMFGGAANDQAIELAYKLAQYTPASIRRFHWTCGGSESNDSAIKIARYYWRMQGKEDKYKVVSRVLAYHGLTYGAMSATGMAHYWTNFGPTVPGFIHIPPPYCYRCPWEKQYGQCDIDCAQALDKAIEAEGDTVAEFIAEPVIGTAGVIPPPPEYFPMVREICTRRGVLLHLDEVVTGFGRTGKFFAAEHWGIQPDLMSMAKALTSGYLPLGAVGITEEIYQGLMKSEVPFFHGLTYNGHPVCCAAAIANIDIIVKENLVENAARMGKYMLERLQELLDLPYVGDVRGLGLVAAIELVEDKKTKAKFDPQKKIPQQVFLKARENGLVCRAMGDNICFSPPLIITREEIDLMVDRIRPAIESIGSF